MSATYLDELTIHGQRLWTGNLTVDVFNRIVTFMYDPYL
jgi:hypothetical protein